MYRFIVIYGITYMCVYIYICMRHYNIYIYIYNQIKADQPKPNQIKPTQTRPNRQRARARKKQHILNDMCMYIYIYIEREREIKHKHINDKQNNIQNNPNRTRQSRERAARGLPTKQRTHEIYMNTTIRTNEQNKEHIQYT